MELTLFYIVSSLPRVFTTMVQCAFGTYFWEMYTFEFGWSPAEWGTVQELFNKLQMVMFVMIGLLLMIVDILAYNANKNDRTVDRNIVVSLTAVACLLHSVYLPVGWYGTETPLVDSLFGKDSNFLSAWFIGPVFEGNLRTILFPSAAHLDLTVPIYEAILDVDPHEIHELWKLPCRYIIHPKFKKIATRPDYISSVCSMPDMPMDLDPKQYFSIKTKPPPVVFMGICPSLRAFMKTQKGIVYFWVCWHGIAMCLFELCTQAIPAKTVTPSNIGKLISVNMMVFTVSNLVIIWLFSAVRYWWRSPSKIAQTFLVVMRAIIIGQIILLVVFVVLSINDPPDGQIATMLDWNNGPFPNSQGHQINNNDAGSGNTGKINPVPSQTTHDKPGTIWYQALPFVQILSFTTFHATVYFWIFTGGPLTFYVSEHYLDGDALYRSIGVPVILIGFTITQIIPGSFTLWHVNVLDYPRVPDFDRVANTNSAAGDPPQSGDPKNAVGRNADQNDMGMMSRRFLLASVICLQFTTLIVFCRFDYSWNKNRWLNYMVLVATGAVNTLFLSYTYVCMGLSIGLKKWKMIVYGVFYAIMAYVVSKAMGIMFRSFNADEISIFSNYGIRFNYRNYFPVVYKTITSFFWFLNIIGFTMAVVVSSSVFSNVTLVGWWKRTIHSNQGGSRADIRTIIQTVNGSTTQAQKSSDQGTDLVTVLFNGLVL